MSHLLCDGSLICWNCALFKFNKNHNCWKCDVSPALSHNHLVKDPVLDTIIKEYLGNGRLQLGYMEALKNRRKELEVTEKGMTEVGTDIIVTSLFLLCQNKKRVRLKLDLLLVAKYICCKYVFYYDCSM